MKTTEKSVKIIVFSLILTVKTMANVHYIDISKISAEMKHHIAFEFIVDNLNYYDHWTPEWKYDKSKESLIPQLRSYFHTFEELTPKNVETYLLLGSIAHYLYNMEVREFFDVAVRNYGEANKSAPKDFRAFWFLGYHYALAGWSILAVENFKKAEKLLASEQPEFWDDYAYISAMANMPSHSIYAMNKVKSIIGEEGYFEERLGESVRERIVPIDKERTYEWDDIWICPEIQSERLYISRPLGVKIQLDTAWNVHITDYRADKQAGFIIYPPRIKNKNGKDILYTMLVMMKVADKNETLDDFINRVTSKHLVKKKIEYSKKYDKMIGYEITNKSLYEDMGGAHMLFIGIERDEPEYPGLLLEIPFEPQNTKSQNNLDGLNIWRPIPSKDRFKGKIFYIIVLDSCEDIYQKSASVFKSMFDNQLIIE